MLFLKCPRDGSRDAHLEHCTIWPKGSSCFYVKTQRKRRFSFSPITVLNNVFTVLFHCFLQSFRHLHNSIFPKGLSFGQANIKPVSTSIAALKLYTMFLKCSHCTSARIQFPEMGLWKVLIFGSYVIYL